MKKNTSGCLQNFALIVKNWLKLLFQIIYFHIICTRLPKY